MSVHVPKREGELRKSGRINSDGTQLMWPMEYAHYQYLGVSKLGKEKWKYTTPETGPLWDKTTMADPTLNILLMHLKTLFRRK